MNPQDPLAALKPIHLPPDPSWWPPAPGWWLLGLTALLMLSARVWWLQSRRRAAAPRHEAWRVLEQIEALPDPTEQLRELNQLLRRAARQVHGPEAASQAPGAWARFLSRTAPPELAEADWTSLAELAYRPQTPERCGEYLALGRAWLRSNL